MSRKSLTAAEAARVLGLARHTVSQHAASGIIPGCYKEGRDWRLPAAEVEKYVDTRRKPGRPPASNKTPSRPRTKRKAAS